MFRLTSYDESTAMATFKLGRETLALPGLTRAGAENTLALQKRGRRFFLTLGFEDADGGAVVRFPRGIAMRRRPTDGVG